MGADSYNESHQEGQEAQTENQQRLRKLLYTSTDTSTSRDFRLLSPTLPARTCVTFHKPSTLATGYTKHKLDHPPPHSRGCGRSRSISSPCPVSDQRVLPADGTPGGPGCGLRLLTFMDLDGDEHRSDLLGSRSRTCAWFLHKQRR
jgi:hypothetical protein